MCRMLTHGERRNDFAVWTVRTHLFRVRRSSHVPSSLPSSTTTSTALLCRTVCEGPFPFWPEGQYGNPVYRSNGPFTGRMALCVRVLTKMDKRPSQRAELRMVVHATSSGPLWCTGTGLQLWSVVCGVRGLSFYTSHHITSLHPLPYTAISMATVTRFCGADVW